MLPFSSCPFTFTHHASRITNPASRPYELRITLYASTP